VIFLSSVPAWQYRTLRTLPPELQAELHNTRQYHDQAVTPLPLLALDSPVTRWLGDTVLGENARLVRLGADGEAGSPAGGIGLTADRGDRYLEISRDVGPAGWTMQVMAPLDPVLASARGATVGAALAYACVGLLLVNLRQRRQRARDMQYSRRMLEAAYDELERRVEARTADLMAINEQLEAEVAERTRAEGELRATQDELVQASKLAALGQMAAGITHELNQPLAALRSFSDNTRVLLERGDQAAAHENLEAIASLTERMGKITNQLKLFVGRARPRSARAPVARALRNVLALLQKRLQGVTVDVTMLDATRAAHTSREPFDVNAEHPEVVANCDDLRLEQVLINLLGNALDAVALTPAPRIAIDMDASETTLAITVRDNGPGIAADVLPRLFEPFFTTKEMGQGLGLGLAISSSIARDCGGSLVARNEPDGGAAFVLTLHRARTPVGDPLAAST
jgi:two-component system C4-dicarboxylate transport sensor histidine kinase DctB